MSSPNFIKLWTAQRDIVLETLETEGVYYVKNVYIDMKYQDTAWIFKEAYSFFRQHAAAHLPKPPQAESAIWLYHDKQWTGGVSGCKLCELDIPRDYVLDFDLRLWNKILNLEYLPANEADAKHFQDNLEKQGLNSTFPAFNTPFYPQIKMEVKSSWKRLFGSANGCPDAYLQSATWELRKEWLTNVHQI